MSIHSHIPKFSEKYSSLIFLTSSITAVLFHPIRSAKTKSKYTTKGINFVPKMLGGYVAAVMVAMIIHEGRSNKLSSPLDLSHPLNNNTQYWIPEEKFYITNRIVVENSPTPFYAANSFIGHEHCGTHLDAPYHYSKTGWKVDEIPLDRLISPGIYIDVSDKVNNCNFSLLPEHLEEWVKTHGSVPKGVILLVNFGWWTRYDDRLAYFGNLTMPYCFPGISAEAAEWIVKNGGIHGVALDTPSLDAGNSDTYPAHVTLLQSNIFGIENIHFDRIQLEGVNFKVIALPMKITGGSGAPCRVVAI